MTDVLNYAPDAPKSRQRDRKRERENRYLPPDLTERFDARGRRIKSPADDDGEVKRRPTNAIASMRLKSLRIERALAQEAENASKVTALNIANRPDRLTAPTPAICDAVVEHFKTTTNISFGDIRNLSNRSPAIVYVRHILFELFGRHGRQSAAQFAVWFGIDHSSISYARSKIRATIVLPDIESRALRADLDAITVALAEKFSWSSTKRNSVSVPIAHRLRNHIKTINLFWSMHGRAQPTSIVNDMIEACTLLECES